MIFENAAADLVSRLQASLVEAVQPHVSANYALLDFPNHANVGDSAIWLGELRLFERLGVGSPAYVCDFRTCDEASLRAATSGGTIFLHGGGNFGDTWLQHQRFREAIIERYRDRAIVQLPQSIHYADRSRIAATASIIAGHPRFTLMVRDHPSLAFAERHFECPVVLCPDSAFAIGIKKPSTARIDVLAMMRRDRESVGAGDLPADVRVEDWLDENGTSVRFAKALAAAGAVARLRPAQMRSTAYEAAARHRVNRGFRQLSQGRAIVTDRLHVHIMSLLLGRPHAVLDNVYGKIGRFMAAFTGASTLTYRAQDLPDAVAWARASATA